MISLVCTLNQSVTLCVLITVDDSPPNDLSVTLRLPIPPPSPKDFQYSDLKEGEIRVVNLQYGSGTDVLSCSLSIENLGLTPTDGNDFPADYDAVSYCWGSSERSHSIKCNVARSAQIEISPGRRSHVQYWDQKFNSCLKITENAKSLLVHLRDTKQYRLLWIDSISINQEDDAEKGQQVKLMTDIYSTDD